MQIPEPSDGSGGLRTFYTRTSAWRPPRPTPAGLRRSAEKRDDGAEQHEPAVTSRARSYEPVTSVNTARVSGPRRPTSAGDPYRVSARSSALVPLFLLFLLLLGLLFLLLCCLFGLFLLLFCHSAAAAGQGQG